eukprot:TRINITY_DN2962_c0_g1_i1.p1 TRINITY_DN2962_c0_g1~~TRINITY_DN2962_c0_g1_i1.p1  ORF type:complete len:538 (+),score=201.21 TRINITY_DN2962_c0_g1_i1:158-1771(+)
MAQTQANAAEAQEIEKLYKYSEDLDRVPSEISKHEDIYKNILASCKASSNKIKTLAVQFVTRYFKHFPKLADEAINSLMDLCEEEDVQLRLQPIKMFPQICKENIEVLPKVADVLGQLLQSDVTLELDAVRSSLLGLLRLNTKGVIHALFNQILTRDETQREKAVGFLRDKVKDLVPELIAPHEDVQRYLADNVKKAISDVNGEEEFRLFMDLLTSLPIFQGPNSKELLDLVANQADMETDLKATDVESVQRFLVCLKMSLQFFQRGATNPQFFTYLANSVLPHFSQLNDDNKIQLLKCVAEISAFANSGDAKTLLPQIFALVQTNVPDGKKMGEESPKINFSYIECLLYTLIQLGSKSTPTLRSLIGISSDFTGQPSDNIGEDNTEKWNDFHGRITFLLTNTQKYTKQLSTSLQKLEKSEKEKKDTVAQALQTTKNIEEMSKVLSNRKPQLNASGIRLSWKPKQKQGKQEKRKDAPNGDRNQNDQKRGRGDQGGHQRNNQQQGNKQQNFNRGQQGGRGQQSGRGRGRGGARNFLQR